jgi:hypothetical protein
LVHSGPRLVGSTYFKGKEKGEKGGKKKASKLQVVTRHSPGMIPKENHPYEDAIKMTIISKKIHSNLAINKI